MDPLSVVLGCFTLVPSIVKTSLSISNFILEVRSARKEMDMITNELNQLKSVLIILDEDTKQCPRDAFPAFLVDQVKIIVGKCQGAVNDIEKTIRAHNGDRNTKATTWVLFGRNEMETLRKNLEAYKSGLEIAMGTLNMALTKNIKADTTKLLDDTAELKGGASQILREIAKLESKLEEKLPNSGSLIVMQKFLGSVTTYAASSRGCDADKGMNEESKMLTSHEAADSPIGVLAPSQFGYSPPLGDQLYSGSESISTLSLPQTPPLLDMPLITSSDLSLLPFEFEKKLSELALSDVPCFEGTAFPFAISDQQYSFEEHTDLVYAVCQVGNLVISGSKDMSIRIWDATSGRLRQQPLLEHRGSVHCIVADETQDLLVSGDSTGRMLSWQLSTGTLQQDIPEAHDGCVMGVALNSRYLVSASHDCIAKVWDRNIFLAQRDRRRSQFFPCKVLRGHTSAILALVITHEKAITAGKDCRIRVFDLKSGTCLQKISTHENLIITLAICKDQQHIISAGADPYILVHNIDSGNLVTRLDSGHGHIIRTLQVVKDEDIFISGSYDKTIAIWVHDRAGSWKKDRILNVTEAQRNLGLDILAQKHDYDLPESIQKAVKTGKGADVQSRGKVFALCSNGRQILCGAGSTILGWDFDEGVYSPMLEAKLRTPALEQPPSPSRVKSRARVPTLRKSWKG